MRCLAREILDQGSSSSSLEYSGHGVDICNDYTDTVSSELSLVSPGYPHQYPALTECRCLVTAQQRSKVSYERYSVGFKWGGRRGGRLPLSYRLTASQKQKKILHKNAFFAYNFQTFLCPYSSFTFPPSILKF